MIDKNITHSIFDLEDKPSDNDSLNTPDFHNTIQEIVGDLADYIQTQGPASDEEMRSIIDEFIFQKVSRGEMSPDEATDIIKVAVLEEWKHRKEELMVETRRVIR